MRCQRRMRTAVAAMAMELVCLATACAPRQPTAGRQNLMAAPDALAAATRLTRRLCRALDLPSPLAVELAPVPDFSRGLSYAAVIRLQPAPFPLLLSTLFHETGHSGPVRDRDVEEAIAALVRRALVEQLATSQPGLAARLVPDLVLGSGHADRPALYTEAARLAAALHTEITARGTARPTGGSACGDVSPEACLAARAARLGRTLTSVEVRRLADEHLPRSRWPGSTRQEPATTLGGLLDALAGDRRLTVAGRERVAALAEVLRPGHTPSLALARFADLSLRGDAVDRRNGYVVVSELAVDAVRPTHYLDRWLSGAKAAGHTGERVQILTRRALLRVELADGAGARADLMDVLFGAEEAAAAAFAIVWLARLDGLGAGDVERLLELSPALQATGPVGAELRGHTLAGAGHPATALPYFARAAARGQNWTLTIGWAEALAAAGHRATAAALLAARAQFWHRLGDDARAGAALLAAVEMNPQPAVARVLMAARWLTRAGAWPDRALDIAARLLETRGKCRAARSIRRRLAATVPGSDHAGAQRATGSRCPPAAVSD